MGVMTRLSICVAAWRDTASARADARIRADGSDLHYLDVPVPVPRPEREHPEKE
ncbi:hypothetical protein IU485_14040 [Nocardia cyriacigeorgica]|nr:hypothetical protein [Nocardia cyriacigeorgica]MBF6082483.1 hypothetical protein [Nocardia cyriacigeorgica]MBF6425427.1 hypothetical protein [Nocardia cyriacigeorgica]BDU09104.1 hypothetical protein FMUBM48_53670 [Nocardia cyriacigeorgica]